MRPGHGSVALRAVLAGLDVERNEGLAIASQFDRVAAAAEGCDVLVASGLMPAAVAGTIRTDGATVAATMLLDGLSRERVPASR